MKTLNEFRMTNDEWTGARTPNGPRLARLALSLTALLLLVIVLPARAGSIAGYTQTPSFIIPAPVQGAQVRIVGPGVNIVTNTDVAGYYFVTNLAANTYTVTCISTGLTITPASRVVVVAASGGGANVTGVSFTNTLALSGRVVGANGSPAPGVTVSYRGPTSLYSVNQLAIDYVVDSTSATTLNFSDASGGYFAGFTNTDNFGITAYGSFTNNVAGVYQFVLRSDDGSDLQIDGKSVINHDGLHSGTAKTNSVFLPAGAHDYLVRHFEASGNASLRLDYTPPGGPQQLFAIPNWTVTGYDLRARTISTATSAADGGFTLANQRIFGPLPLNAIQLVADRPGYTISSAITVTNGGTNYNFTVTASPPAISVAAAVSTPEDVPVVIPFTVNDLQTLPAALTVTAASSNQAVVTAAGLTLGGAGANRTLTVTPFPGVTGTNTLTLTVTDGAFSSATTSVTLVITPANDAPVAGSKFGLHLSNNFVRATAPALALSNASFTVEFWGRRAAPGEWDVAASQGLGTTTNNSNLGNRHLHIGFRDNNSFTFGFFANDLDTPAYTDTDWHHWAASYDIATGDRRIYRDGQLVAIDVTTNFFRSTANFLIGGAAFDSTFSWNGQLDEMRVWDHARTDSDLNRLRRVPLVGNEPGLLAYWRMDENDGQVLRDSSNHGRDATLTGWPHWSRSTNSPGFNAPIVPEDSLGTALFLPGYDAETRDLTFTNVTVSTGLVNRTSGTITNFAQNPITYTPPANFTGSVALTFVVQDASGLRDTNTIFLSVLPANDPPTVSALAAQVILENTTRGPLNVTVGDPDHDAGTLIFTARSSDQSVVANAGFVLGGSGSNRSLTITPVPNESGTTLITLSVFDGDLTTETSFQLRVEPLPAYKIIDLGALPNRGVTAAAGVNDLGAAAGNASVNNAGGSTRAFINEGLDSGGAITEVDPGAAGTVLAAGLNNFGEVVGTADTGGGINKAFVRGRVQSVVVTTNVPFPGFTNVVTNVVTTFVKTTLNTLGGAQSWGTALNDDGVVVGYSEAAGAVVRAFIRTNGATLTPLGPLPGFTTSSRAFGVNATSLVAGASYSAAAAQATLWTLTSTQALGFLPGGNSSVAYAVNAFGAVAGTSSSSNGSRAFLWQDGAMTSLGALSNAVTSEARALNAFGQVAGWSRVNNEDRATLHSAGFLYDLNELVSEEDAAWKLQQALGINARGDLVGVGEFNGQRRAFLAIPANVIGRKLTRPAGTVASLPPTITLLSNAPGDTAGNAFHRSAATQKSYAVRPVLARISWPTTTDLFNTSSLPVVVVSANIWPRTPQVHIAGTPVEFNPAVANFAHAYQSLLYVTNGANVDGGTKLFTAHAPGWTVALFLRNNGQPTDPQTQPPYLEVIRTFHWYDDRVLVDNVPAPIGQPVTSAFHRDHPGRNGWVVFDRAPYDGTGAERAHDRVTRLGPILPVNIDSSASNDDLVITWYATNGIRVAWGHQPVRYTPEWPENPPEIVIASTLGSGSLTPAIYGTTWRVYNQPDTNLAGFNPNEEHALLAPANGDGGTALFALRNDLNRFRNHSEPYALLKYVDPATFEWRIQPFRVVETNAQYQFRYEGTAGNEIQPPYPLSLLNLCAASHGVSGPYWEDYNGKLYARAAGLGPDLNATVTARWSYPLQPGFFYDLNDPSGADQAVGLCVGWLDKRVNSSQPVDVSYDIHWPDAPVLQIGETLINPKRGLPGVRNWASAEVIWDSAIGDGVFTGTNLLNSSARLFDPIVPRTVTAAAGFVMPSAIQTTLREGKLTFNDLPFDLGSRLTFEPTTRKLTWQGFLDAAVAGEPLLLLNVMSECERDRIKALSSDSAFMDLVDALYAKTRNPNNVDLDANGSPDDALRVGLTTNAQGQVVLEPLPGDKALTAAVGSAPPATFAPGKALRFDGVNDFVNAGTAVALNGQNFALEFWAKRALPNNDHFLVSQGVVAPFAGFFAGFRADNRFVFSFHESGVDEPLVTSAAYTDTGWHHWAVTFNTSSRQRVIYRDGVAVASDTAADGYTGSGELYLGRGLSGGYFSGDLDDVRIWNQPRTAFTVAKDRNKRLLGSEGGLLRYFLCDEASGTTLTDTSGTGNATLMNAVARLTSDAPTGALPRFLTLAENNVAALGLPVSLHIIRVDDGPFVGDLKVLPPANVFDEKLPIRHSSDFAAEPERVTFEWYYKPDQADLDPTDLPTVDPVTGNVLDARGWLVFTSFTPASGQGVNYVTLGDGGQSSLLTLGDNYFITRYRGLAVNGVTNWSDWAGDPSGGGTPRAALAEGWIKRVIRGLNPIDQRVAEFHTTEVSTFASMLIQAGTRYEGDIAFNPDGASINSVGLIEAYETVLRRGRRLSIDGTPSVNFDSANNALLLVATKIADLYVMLGNESFADAADATIGFGIGQGEYGTAATSIFAFQNQLDSLLEEELVLLRGRDDRNAGVAAPPVYNRLFWNFTLAEGELAYQQVYNINDFNVDGFIDERDARLQYPQGHGDAWGHYLTGIKKYYELLRHPNFTWIPRTERVNVNGVAVEVDFLDERKFARVAAARAKTGGEIMNLTYRFNYVDDPDGQWQGYKDGDEDRAWGVTEWGRRAGQGALFDWMVANAVLPATDPDTNHVGITKIDRTTVLELREIASALTELQGRMDQADVGLNPIGVAKGAVPFDIDPALFLSGLGFQGQTHFEQIYARAMKAMNNAVKVWDEANKFSSLLRRNQDDVDNFIPNIRDQELDYRNQLLEIFGYPYAGDIGPGKTYPTGYDGPDLYHYMYVKTDEITGENFPPSPNFVGIFSPVDDAGTYSFYVGVSDEFRNDYSGITNLEIDHIEVTYPQIAGNYTFSAPASWGSRRAPGEIQEALSEVVAAQGRLKFALQNYDGVILNIEDMLDVLAAQHNVNAEELALLNTQRGELRDMNISMGALKAGQIGLRRASATLIDGLDAAVENIPKVVGLATDVTAPLRGALKAAAFVGARIGLETAADALEITENSIELAKEDVEQRTEISIITTNQSLEVLQRVKEIEKEIREEPVNRLEVYIQREELLQAIGRYQMALAKGERLLEELLLFRKRTAAEVTENRYEDMTFRIFRNDALQKYRAAFDLAARYVYLAANAYEYDLNFLGTDARSGSEFLTDIVRQRSLGQIIDGVPIVGLNGLADPLGRLAANFEILKPQLGLNNPQFEDSRFSLRHELFRIGDGPDGDAIWREQLQKARVANLWDVPEFRRYCRPFATESAGAQPALVFRFPTTITFGQNFFGRNLGPGDSGYDPSVFSTKVAGAGVWFTGAGANLSQTPRVYFFPAGMDILRSPTGDTLATREWRVLDQAVPVPFPIGASDLNDPTFNPTFDSLSGAFTDIRRYSSMRAYHDQGIYSESQTTSDTRLIGRSVWNTEWILVIPGGTLLFNANQGIDTFINTVDDVKIYFRTYSYSGN